MIVSAQRLRLIRPVEPFEERSTAYGLTYGLGPAGYDCRIAETVELEAGEFALASTIEHFTMPNNLLGVVHDKSTLARLGIATQNTVIEPGWKGFLTLELTNHSKHKVIIQAGVPICQVVFHRLDFATENPYDGKYQDQEAGPQKARFKSKP